MGFFPDVMIYGIQLAAVFALAGPVLARAERRKTLSRNPAWVRSQPELLRAFGEPSLAPIKAAGAVLAILLIAAAAAGSPLGLFVVHGPLFLLALAGLYLHYWLQEKRLRERIPKDNLQRAPLAPRSLERFLSKGALIPPTALLIAACAINGYGWVTGSLSPGRAFGNLVMLLIFTATIASGLVRTVRRQPYRISEETDTLGRQFDLRIILVVAYYFSAVSLFYALGSFGASPLVDLPPTSLHAWFEGTRFSWDHFLRDPQYRIVDYASSLFLAALCVWMARSRFLRTVSVVDFRTEMDLSKV